ncbi:MAG TPA: EthD family reductase [Gemmatimonadaceae bacterium]
MPAKLMVMYPQPKMMDDFERAYADEHIPMAASIFTEYGATKAVMSKAVGASTGAPAFHRIAEIHFPSMDALQRCAAGKGQDALAHAHKISNGGPPVVIIAEEDVIPLSK